MVIVVVEKYSGYESRGFGRVRFFSGDGVIVLIWLSVGCGTVSFVGGTLSVFNFVLFFIICERTILLETCF